MRPAAVFWIAILLSIVAALALAFPAHAGQKRPPNVVVILADDLGWGDVGFNGRTDWTTPNLDRLAKRGIKFNRWYTAAVVCAPSRAALLTGKYTIHNGVSANNDDLPRSEVTLAAALRGLGYRTALAEYYRTIGKLLPQQGIQVIDPQDEVHRFSFRRVSLP